MGNLQLYLSIYLLPMVILLAAYAPDLELSPRLHFTSGSRLPSQAVTVSVWLTLANLVINAFLSLAIEPQQLLVMAAWQVVYLIYAYRVGPWLH